MINLAVMPRFLLITIFSIIWAFKSWVITLMSLRAHVQRVKQEVTSSVMVEKIVIGLVVVIALGGHWWLILWIKFKVDEGAILNLLKQAKTQTFHRVEQIADPLKMAQKRVAMVCNKSQKIKVNPIDDASWGLN